MLDSANLTGARLGSSHLTGVQFENALIMHNYAQILFFKLFNVKKLGFMLPPKRYKYTICYFIENLHFIFIKWNFKPDCKNAKYDESTTFPEWLDPVKADMIKISAEQKEPEASNVPNY